MKYILKPSLQHITCVKISVSLWMQKDVRDLISNFSDLLPFEWQNINNRVIAKVSQLPIPGILKEKVTNFVKPIGSQIFKWIQYHCRCEYFPIDMLDELCWTPQGTIDKKKTIEVLIKNSNLDIIKRYNLACFYCLENDIIEFKKEILENHRQSFSNVHKDLVTYYWRCTEQTRYNNPLHQIIFQYCAKKGNKAATNFFLQKLTPLQRKRSLVSTAVNVEDAEVLLFLLSQMNEEQEKKVFKIIPQKLMQCLLDWPWQNIFFEVINYMWEFISKDDFEYLLKMIISKTRNGYNDCIYEKLFKTLWKDSPSALKSYVANEYHYGSLLNILFTIKDKNKIEFIFQDSIITEKNNVMKIICEQFFFEGEWDVVRFLIQEFISSETERIKFKEECERNIEKQFWKDDFLKLKGKWDQLFAPSHSVHKFNKREYQEDAVAHVRFLYIPHKVSSIP